MGFFGDPVSAKQVAAQLRSNFASAAVVPVGDEEVTRARDAAASTAIPILLQQRSEATLDSNGRQQSATESKPFIPGRMSRNAETLMQTLKKLAERELWTDPDSLSESGVRHLRVEVQERTSGRS